MRGISLERWTALMREFDQFDEFLRGTKKILISTHINPDGDGLGAALALKRVIDTSDNRFSESRADIVIADRVPDNLRFLKGTEQIVRYNDGVSSEKYDGCVMIDANELHRVGDVRRVFEKFSADRVAVFDHHEDPAIDATTRVIEPAFSSTCELLWKFFMEKGYLIDELSAKYLYTGVIVDTGNFRQANSSPTSHECAADLIRRGVPPQTIFAKIFESRSTPSLHLIGLMLERFELTPDEFCIYSYLENSDLERFHARPEDTDNLINYLREHYAAQVMILFRETAHNRTKINFRAKNGINILQVAQKFNGGGHKVACGTLVELPLRQAINAVISEVQKVFGQDRVTGPGQVSGKTG